MRGIPKWLNTKEDVLRCIELAIDGQLDKQQLKKKLQDLMSDEKVYMFKQIVNEGYTPAEGERVCEVKKEDGSVEYHCYELQENPNARFAQMGFTKEELQGLINQL
ncbi:hypothetical protein [Thermodesulfovibrio yellowstonii]|uniref:hypothetical protein n=1 Tax=Thermodesulfovibrio yellowstonii TaxID=28262 RepID=UPI0024B3622A|nr:hypothetical protein [Thermodesulfovibrio yellowstonii]MDI6865813.1 hypothetical protein [Thermodesulfovibrio yellowstonii]